MAGRLKPPRHPARPKFPPPDRRHDITAVTAHFLGVIRYDAATHDADGNPLPTEQGIHSKVIAEDIADELLHSLGHEKPIEGDYLQKVREVSVRPAEPLQEALTRAAQINAVHQAPGHGMECTCDLDALELVEQLAAYASHGA
ncbi:hypothetical protein [Streptomyces sp. NPDC001828]|uniref:hypothetical protein n=1 Tax=Streptomyces sp. NPDC001828 TaxID=3364615 RepID=UPI0036C77F8C